MREALDMREALHLHAAGLADAAEVVAAEVHEHRVLRVLLRVGLELALELGVAQGGLAARARSGDGRGRGRAPGKAHELLRRRPDQRLRADAQEEVVGRGVDRPQRAVERETGDARAGRELLRGDNLDHLAGRDRVLALRDHRAELLLRHFGLELAGGCAVAATGAARDARDRLGAEKLVVERLDATHGGLVGVRFVRVRDDGDRHGVAHVVEGEEGVADEERHRRRPHLGHQPDARLEKGRGVVGDVAHGPALEGRQLGRRGIAQGGEARLEFPEGVGTLDAAGRFEAEVGVAAPGLAARDAFEEKCLLVLLQAGEGGDGRLAIGEELPEHRHAVGVRRASLVFWLCQLS